MLFRSVSHAILPLLGIGEDNVVKASRSGFVEGIAESKIARKVYTGDANASDEVMAAAVGCLSDKLMGEESAASNVAPDRLLLLGTMKSKIQLYDPESGKFSLDLRCTVSGDLAGYQEENFKAGIGGGSYSFRLRLDTETGRKIVGAKSEVHGWHVEKSSKVGLVPGVGVAGALGGQLRMATGDLGIELKLDPKNNQWGMAADAVASVIQYKGFADMIIDDAQALRASGEIDVIGKGGGVKFGVQEGYPPVSARGRLVIGVGGGLGLEKIDREQVGDF